MEQDSTLATDNPQVNEDLCVNCQINKFEKGHPVNLCTDCRHLLINYPIPKWIKMFAIGLFAVIIISLVRTQMYISAATHLGKSEKALESRNFVTAQNELNSVLEKFPDDITTNADMIIAATYNLDFIAAKTAFDKISNKNIDDQELFNNVSNAIALVEESFANDTVLSNKITKAAANREQLLQLYNSDKDSTENINKLYIANNLYDLKDYASVENILLDILKTKPDFLPALRLQSALKRENGKFDEGLQVCDRMLSINKQDVYAIAQKARIELKRKHDKQAAVYAKEAMLVDPVNDMALEATAMVNYFAGRKKESLANLSVIKAHVALNGDSTILKRVSAIVNGSEIYR